MTRPAAATAGPVAGPIARFARAMRAELGAEERCLAPGGKELRPRFLIAVGRALGASRAVLREAATVAELVHEASLLQDDAVDEAGARRGRPTAFGLYGAKAGIMLGDIAVIEAFRRAELLAVDAKKTGALFGWCAAAAGWCAGFEGLVDELRAAGRKIGTAFQLIDDLLDYEGARTGKPRFQDLRRALPDYPLAKGLADPALRTRVRALARALLARFDLPKAEALGALLRRGGTLDSCRRDAQGLLREAEASLRALPLRGEAGPLWELLGALGRREA